MLLHYTHVINWLITLERARSVLLTSQDGIQQETTVYNNGPIENNFKLPSLQENTTNSVRGCGLAWSRTGAPQAPDPGSNPGCRTMKRNNYITSFTRRKKWYK